MLTINNLTLTLNSELILKDISFTLNEGSVTTIVGKSGAGKSTLLECIMQLQPHYDGTISIDGKDLKLMTSNERAQAIGMVFQQWYLFPQLSVIGNCTQQLIVVQKMGKSEAQEKMMRLLEQFGMAAYANAYPATLSGGQQQRVAIVRALCLEPKILCLDEPTSALDAENTELLVNQLQEIKRRGTTLIVTSHDTQFIQKLGADTLKIENGFLQQRQ